MKLSDPNDLIYQPVPYEHTRFALGTQVYIDLAIRALFPEHRAAGLVGTVVASFYYPLLELLHSRPYSTYVPVQIQGDTTVFLVEEEYVQIEEGK
jgi:hypothetical protein